MAATAESTWAPLRISLFRTLWIAVLVSNVGTWMQTVGAQWLMVNDSHAALLVPLVQTATAPAGRALRTRWRGSWRTSSTGAAAPVSLCWGWPR